jgi:hypothetical protein
MRVDGHPPLRTLLLIAPAPATALELAAFIARELSSALT